MADSNKIRYLPSPAMIRRRAKAIRERPGQMRYTPIDSEEVYARITRFGPLSTTQIREWLRRPLNDPYVLDALVELESQGKLWRERIPGEGDQIWGAVSERAHNADA